MGVKLKTDLMISETTESRQLTVDERERERERERTLRITTIKCKQVSCINSAVQVS